jgi:TrbL/VirB6 plasmid conjugal transfer protein
MWGSNYYTWVFTAITNLLTANTGIFVHMGENMFRALATIMLAWFGIKIALGAGEFYAGMQFSRFASLVMMIAFGFAMINYYNTPIPGIGVDFHHLVINQVEYLSNTISHDMLDTITNRISAFMGTIEPPGATLEFWTYFEYWGIMILLSVAQAIAMVVVAFGVVATAVCVLVGPIFIPFFIVPQLDWLFWGWFRAFIQYAFYQVIAAAVVYIIGNVLTAFMNLYHGQPIPLNQEEALFAPLLIVVVASVYVLLKVPALTSNIFSGAAGAGASETLNFLGSRKA